MKPATRFLLDHSWGSKLRFAQKTEGGRELRRTIAGQTKEYFARLRAARGTPEYIEWWLPVSKQRELLEKRKRAKR